MPLLHTMIGWVSMLAVAVPLAILLLVAIPSHSLTRIATHVALLVGGSAAALALLDERPRDHGGDRTGP